MNVTWVLCMFILSKISQSESYTLQLRASAGNRYAVPTSVLQQASIPSVTVPVARQTLPTNANIPGVSTDVNVGAIFPGTQTTVGTAGLDVLRRGSELIADRIASALGGIAVLVDVLRNTSVNGDVVWANIGSTSQALATRLLTVGMNTANTLLQELNGQLSISTNPANVLQNFLPNIEQLGSIGAFSRSPGISNQVFFPNRVFTTGQQNNASGSAPLNTGSSNLDGVSPRITITSTSRPGLNTPLNTTNPAETVTNTAQNINSEVETFLDNLSNNENFDVNP
ncbi:uncharacterized protein LOC135844375 isoform X2 [Planococcus citri]|uniref:uncharacterized protein LOC135844375 isoform X2 n=1 Tax=Planococcus citri TaxID=170843 RepID=UPI0031FA4716